MTLLHIQSLDGASSAPPLTHCPRLVVASRDQAHLFRTMGGEGRPNAPPRRFSPSRERFGVPSVALGTLSQTHPRAAVRDLQFCAARHCSRRAA
jgi:hypothetical protein